MKSRNVQPFPGQTRRPSVSDAIVRQFFLGFIRIHILHHAAHEPVCGVGLSKELACHGYGLSPGTLYPILHALEESGYLRSRIAIQAGRRRRNYRITRAGRRVLHQARAQISELVQEVTPFEAGDRRLSGNHTTRSRR